MKKDLFLSIISTLILTGCSSENTGDAFSSFDLNPISTYIDETTNSVTEIITAVEQSTCESIALYTEPTETAEVIPEDGQLVRILDYIPDAKIDLRYATTNNFTGTIIYDDPEAYLCYGTVKKLIIVQNELKEMGYCILIWDAYRSIEAQWKLWEMYPDPTFVANPNNGITSHSRGNTIDMSIVYEDGSPVEMPSAFDEFTAIADRDYSDVSEVAANNSRLLEEIMYRNGFTGYRGEWWDYSDTDRYEVKSVIRNNDIGDTYLTKISSDSQITEESTLSIISNTFK